MGTWEVVKPTVVARDGGGAEAKGVTPEPDCRRFPVSDGGGAAAGDGHREIPGARWRRQGRGSVTS